MCTAVKLCPMSIISYRLIGRILHTCSQNVSDDVIANLIWNWPENYYLIEEPNDMNRIKTTGVGGHLNMLVMFLLARALYWRVMRWNSWIDAREIFSIYIHVVFVGSVWLNRWDQQPKFDLSKTWIDFAIAFWGFSHHLKTYTKCEC